MESSNRPVDASEGLSVKTIALAVGGSALLGLASYSAYCVYNYYHLSKLDIDYKLLHNPETSVKPWTTFSKPLRVRIIDLDGSVVNHNNLIKQYKPEILDLKSFGPHVRIESSFSRFFAFERELAHLTGSNHDDICEFSELKISISNNLDKEEVYRPIVTFFGSNDFHHLSLAYIRRIHQPFNLVLFDNHPDWFKYFPRMHCGCWFTHAVDLPTVQSAFHFGGDSGEFEETWGFHPWNHLESGKLTMFPTEERWHELPRWKKVKFDTLRPKRSAKLTEERIRGLLEPHRETLRKYPVYITLDKDCLRQSDNVQNWNSGSLKRKEMIMILKILLEFSEGRLIGMDVTGDFSSISGALRHYFDWSQHDIVDSTQDPKKALPKNERTNLEILEAVEECLEKHHVLSESSASS